MMTISMYRGWTKYGIARPRRNKPVCVGCTKRTLVVSIFCYSFVCLHCVVPVAMHYILCLMTVHMKVLQNGRLVTFSKKTNCW